MSYLHAVNARSRKQWPTAFGSNLWKGAKARLRTTHVAITSLQAFQRKMERFRRPAMDSN